MFLIAKFPVLEIRCIIIAQNKCIDKDLSFSPLNNFNSSAVFGNGFKFHSGWVAKNREMKVRNLLIFCPRMYFSPPRLVGTE